MLNLLLALSLAGQITIAQRKPEHDLVPKLTREQQEYIDLVVSSCQGPEEPDTSLICQESYSELVNLTKQWYPLRYDRPNLCDKIQPAQSQDFELGCDNP